MSCLLLAGACLAVHAGRAAAESADQGDVAKGQQLYETICRACHGRYGRGDGPLAANLSMPPADLTVAARLETRSDAELVVLLRYGSGNKHTPMVASQVLNEEALQDVVAYLRTLYVPGKHVSVLAGRDIYHSVCWTCHGANGNGEGPSAKNLQGTKPRDFTAADFQIEGREAELHRTISEGAAKAFHGSEFMLEWGTKLSPQQIDDVIEYLVTFQSSDAGQGTGGL